MKASEVQILEAMILGYKAVIYAMDAWENSESGGYVNVDAVMDLAETAGAKIARLDCRGMDFLDFIDAKRPIIDDAISDVQDAIDEWDPTPETMKE